MSRLSTPLAIAGLSLFFLGCDPDGEAPLSQGDGGFVFTENITFAVETALYPEELAGHTPPDGSRFLYLRVTFRSRSPEVHFFRFGIDEDSFSLYSQAGIRYRPAPETSMLAAYCDSTPVPSDSLAVACDLAFTIPEDATPKMLIYKYNLGRQWSVSIPEPKPLQVPLCLNTSAWKGFDGAFCKSCAATWCESEIAVLDLACRGSDDQLSLARCSGGMGNCECIEGLSQRCQDEITNYLACLVVSCSSACE
jgi:hypothetical protein